MRGNEDYVVVYEKLALPETMLLLLRRRCIETTAGMTQDESVFSTPVSGLFKVDSPSL